MFLLFGSALLAPSAAGTVARLLVPWQAALVLAVAGFCAGAALPRTSTARLIPAALGLVSLWAAVLVGYQQRFHLLGTPELLALGLTGLVVGLAVGVLMGPILRRRTATAGDGPLLGGLALACAAGRVAGPSRRQ